MCRHCYHKKCVIWSTHLNIPCYQEICYLRHSWYESSIFKAYNPRGNTVVTTIHTIGVSSSQLITFTGKLLGSYLAVFQHTAACCYWRLLVEQNLSVKRFNINSSFTGWFVLWDNKFLHNKDFSNVALQKPPPLFYHVSPANKRVSLSKQCILHGEEWRSVEVQFETQVRIDWTTHYAAQHKSLSFPGSTFNLCGFLQTYLWHILMMKWRVSIRVKQFAFHWRLQVHVHELKWVFHKLTNFHSMANMYTMHVARSKSEA